MKTYGGVDVYIHVFFTSALAAGEWSSPRPGRFTPGEKAPDTPWIRVWVDPRAGLDDVACTGTRTLTPRPSIPAPYIKPVEHGNGAEKGL
jgi:hypothetical protein